LAEILTLIQTGKTRRIPIVLVDSNFWQGLVDWFKNTLVKEGTISPDDPNLFVMVDDADSAVEYILKHQTDITEPATEEEQKKMMEI
ncbi:MAG: TIGR00730 family Rossman fold protein, partial [Aquificaceae bacterium]